MRPASLYKTGFSSKQCLIECPYFAEIDSFENVGSTSFI